MIQGLGADMEEEEERVLTPQVKWAQRKHMIILRVFIKPLENPDFTIREDYMTFKGPAVGMSGRAIFGFQLIFYEPVHSDKCRVKFLENEVEFRLMKKQEGVWPRLQASQEKPHWISLDFDHWEYQHEEGSEEEEEGEGDKKNKLDPELLKKMAKAQSQLEEMESDMKAQVDTYNTAANVLSKLKTAYLLIYNGVQWSGFILIVLTLLMSLRGGMEGVTKAYEKTSSMIFFCHMLMMVEILHAAVGVVKSGVASTFLQVFGRFLMTFVVLMPAVEIHTHPIMFALFLVWSLIEVIRYPFYALSVINMEVSQLTWLRYSAWIPLYPLGFTCEALTIWLSLGHYDNSTDFHYPLPNKLNISFYPPYVLRVAICIVPLIAFNQITHMIAQRRKKLGKKLKTL